MILQCQMWGSWGADRGDIPLDAQQGLELNEPHHQDPDAQIAAANGAFSCAGETSACRSSRAHTSALLLSSSHT